MQSTTQKVYDIIVDYYNKYNYMPTIRELCKLTGLSSTSSVYYHLEKLKEKDLIESDHEFKARGWRLTK